jgi:hypothetical protein
LWITTVHTDSWIIAVVGHIDYLTVKVGIVCGTTGADFHFLKKNLGRLNNMPALIAIAMLILLPLGAMWGFNTVFDMGLEYDLKTWAGMLVLLLVLDGTVRKSKS